MSASTIETPISIARRVSGRTLKRALMVGIGRVLAERDPLNRINVFPVPDGDTGSNLAFTLASVREALLAVRGGNVQVILERVGSEAIDGARGNSGAILAQFLQGEGFAGQRHLALEQLAEASGRGSRQARQAIAEPREGTMLSVIQVFAQSLGLAREQGVIDLRAGYERALVASRNALADTPNQLAVLRKAGVVDAGAQGFLHLLEGIQEFIRHGRNVKSVEAAPISTEQGVIAGAHVEADSGHRWCTECVVSASDIDRSAVRAALDAIPGSSLVIAGTREKLRVHMHVDAPALLFEALSSFGEVRAAKADDMQAQQRAVHASGSIAVVVDSAADLPGDSLEQLSLHVVPVRINVGSTDYLDKVSLSPQGFHALLRDSDQVVRTSQPPPGDFRRLFEFLLSHHAEVLYVGVSRAISGTLQSGESAGAALGSRVHVFDSENVSGGQGLLAVHAAERAASGVAITMLLRELEQLRAQTATFAYVRDLTAAVRGGRVPAWSLPLTRWLRLVPLARIGGRDGRLHIHGVCLRRPDLPARFVSKVLRGVGRKQAWRAQVMHCCNPEEAAQVRSALLEQLPGVECAQVFDAGSAIGAHAGSGAVVLALMPRLPVAQN